MGLIIRFDRRALPDHSEVESACRTGKSRAQDVAVAERMVLCATSASHVFKGIAEMHDPLDAGILEHARSKSRPFRVRVMLSWGDELVASELVHLFQSPRVKVWAGLNQPFRVAHPVCMQLPCKVMARGAGRRVGRDAAASS